MSVNRTLVGDFEKLRWHRCLVVEAMREIAFRNRDHFYVSSVRLGLSDRTTPEAVTVIFDRMLEDQGEEPTEANRWVLGWAYRASWEVYMCLLYSLVERLREDAPRPSQCGVRAIGRLPSIERGADRRTEGCSGQAPPPTETELTTTTI